MGRYNGSVKRSDRGAKNNKGQESSVRQHMGTIYKCLFMSVLYTLC